MIQKNARTAILSPAPTGRHARTRRLRDRSPRFAPQAGVQKRPEPQPAPAEQLENDYLFAPPQDSGGFKLS
jgi:hypothetical protein